MKKIFRITFVVIAFLQSALLINAQDFLSAVPTTGSMTVSIPTDIYIKPQSGRANQFHSGENINNSYDLDMTTLYHSPWSGQTVFPVILDYMFAATVSQIDYVVYYPRTAGGTNGNFKQIEVWYAAGGKPLQKYNDYDFGGSSSPSTVVFEPAIIRPDTIRFIVKSGMGDGQGTYASCAEMKFYQKNPAEFDYSKIFTDITCSKLKPGITMNDINAINIEFYRKLASDIYNGFYDPEFRIQEYKSYQTPEIQAQINKTSYFGLYDNPTGIYAGKGSDVVLLVDNIASGQASPSLYIQQYGSGPMTGATFALHAGLNKVTAPYAGLMYIRYYTTTGTEPPVRINILGGIVNGYYDKSRHTAADWSRLLANASFPLFEMKGDYAALNFQTSDWRTNAATTGPQILDLYDNLVYKEQEFQGMVKYNRMNKTRMLFQIDLNPNASYMYSTSYYTGYSLGTPSGILNVSQLTDPNAAGGAAWGPSHELGHSLQTRPGFKWVGLTEVTNNVLSQYMTINLFGNKSRLQYENMGGGTNRYTLAINGIVKSDTMVSYLKHSDVFCRLVPFWQLKLYMMDVLGKTDFYKDLYEKVRVNPDPVAANGCSADGMCQLQFIRWVCEISQLDMTDFFTDWKFLTPVSVYVDDYTGSTFTITKQAIDQLKADIAAAGYPKPPVPAGLYLYNINDSNWQSYKP